MLAKILTACKAVKRQAVPTLVSVDRSGRVQNAWIGMLSPRQELEVMRPRRTCCDKLRTSRFPRDPHFLASAGPGDGSQANGSVDRAHDRIE